MKKLILDGNSLTIDAVYQLATSPGRLEIRSSAKQKMRASRRVVERWVESGEKIYGVTTGFGEFSNVSIGKDRLEQLQENLIMSHAAGAGDPLSPEIVRAMAILRLNAVVKGYSGIRVETAEFFKDVFNAGITPIIPSKGSVGSSGDLAPLAHLILSLLGKGRVWYEGAVMDSALR